MKLSDLIFFKTYEKMQEQETEGRSCNENS